MSSTKVQPQATIRPLRIPTLNQVLIAGRLTRDPDLRFTSRGMAKLEINMAANRRYRNSKDEWQEAVTYVRVIVWRQRAEALSKQLHKGSAILVRGRLSTRKWTDKQGIIHNMLEIDAESTQVLDRVSQALQDESESELEAEIPQN